MPFQSILSRTGQAVADSVVRTFQSRLHGRLVFPDDADYDAARQVWNRRIDRRPALIARCVDEEDVVSAVRFGREHDLLVSVRGGGHDVAGRSMCDGGLTIDLSMMKATHVSPAARTAHAQAGLTWGEFDRATQEHGLAAPGGSVTHTGIAGVTLGGGIGWLTRQYGLTCDNVLSVRLVTADGRLLTASAAEHEDLFWAVRGAGHNFGVVTSFEYRLHPVSTVIGGALVYAFDRARDGLLFYAEQSSRFPDELSTVAGLVTDARGCHVFVVGACYNGDAAAADRALQPLRRFAAPISDQIAMRPYAAMQSFLDERTTAPIRSAWRSHMFGAIQPAAIDTIVSRFPTVRSRRTSLGFHHLGGAVARVAPHETAFRHRDAEYDFTVFSVWSDESADDAHASWTRALGDDVGRFSLGTVYVNGLGDEGDERVRAAYGSHYERLAMLKRKYDPTNLFRSNPNIAVAV